MEAPINEASANFLKKILGHTPEDKSEEKEGDTIKKEESSLFAMLSLS